MSRLCFHRPLLRRWAAALVMCATLGTTASASAHPGGAPDARVLETVQVVTPSAGSWPVAVSSIEFELEQAGYVLAQEGTGAPSTSLTVAYQADGWTLRLEDRVRGLRLDAHGDRDASPQVVGLHAVEMVHASRLDLPKPARLAPRPEPTVVPPPVPPPVAAPPSPPSGSRKTSWALELGVTSSNVGRVGPRIGVAHRWTHAEFGLVAEAGFFSADRPVASRVGLGPLTAPDDLGAEWTPHETMAILRTGIAAAYAFGADRALRPTLGVTNEVVVPLVDTGIVRHSPAYSLTQLGYGVAWVPALELGARLRLAPVLAVRASVRVGPAITLKGIPIVHSSKTIGFPRGIAVASLGLLIGRT